MGQSVAMGIEASPAPGVPRGFQPDEPTRVAKMCDEDGTWGSRTGRQRSGGFESRPASMGCGPMASATPSVSRDSRPPGHHGPEGLLSRPRPLESSRTDVGAAYNGLDRPSGGSATGPAGGADVDLACAGSRGASRLSSLQSLTASDAGGRNSGYAVSNHGGGQELPPPPPVYDSMGGQSSGLPPMSGDRGALDSMADRGYGGAGAYSGAGQDDCLPPRFPGAGLDPMASLGYTSPGASEQHSHYPAAGGPDPAPSRAYGGNGVDSFSHHYPSAGPDHGAPRSADDYACGPVSRCLSAADERGYAASDAGSRRSEYAASIGDFSAGGGLQGIRGSGRPGSPGGQSVGTMSMLSDMSPGAAVALRATPGGGVPPAQAQVGSVVEVFSATTGRWYAAGVTQVQPGEAGEEVLTVQFWMNEDAKQKSMYRNDQQLAPLGTHTGNELPPGFEIRPSQSRPGQLVYLDATTGTKYANAELAWHVHFERMQQRPAVGCETVCAVSSRPPSVASVPGVIGSLAAPSSPPGATMPAAPKALTLAELQASPEVPESWSGGGSARAPAHMDPTLGTAGKVALPCFGDHMGSQAAYLHYEGKAGAADAMAAAAHSAAPALAPLSSAAASAYPTRVGSAPRREGPRRPVRPVNPALQTWQEDAFSEWRN